MTLRIPEILAKRLDAVLAERRREERRFSMNDWLVEAIRGKLDRATEPPRRLDPKPTLSRRDLEDGETVTTDHPQSAIEHAARAEAPIGRSVTEFLLTQGPTVPVAAEPPAPAARAWLPELMKLRKRAEYEDVTEDFTALIGGPFRPPKGWAQWDVKRQAAYLEENHPLDGPGWV